MADDDLMLTNKYTDTDYDNSSDTVLFKKLMDAKQKSKEMYDEDVPDFAKEIRSDQNTGISINENSVAFEQFIKFAETEKQKKIKKTILNIDSRNRTTTYTYDSIPVTYTTSEPLSFTQKSNQFNIELGEVNYIDDIVTHRELILTNLNKTDFNKVGASKDQFEFSPTKGIPIFTVVKFIYKDSADNESVNDFDHGKQKYRYNKLQLNIPNNIEEKQLHTVTVGSGVNIAIITNIKISYPSPSHYFINLGKTFSNVYSVKLISSEIPNTSYTFNENLIETNFGKFKLKTNQNNKLRWVNKTDRVNVSSNNVHMASLFFENMPMRPTLSAADLHTKNFEKLQNDYSITDLTNIENVKRLYSLVRVSQEFSNSPTLENLQKRDYYFKNSYLGEITTTGISDPDGTNNLPNTIFTYNETFISQKARELNAFYHYAGYYKATPAEAKYNTIFQFSSNTSLTISGDDNIAKDINKMTFPIKVTFRCPSKPDYLYIFHVKEALTPTEGVYTATMIPILSHSPNTTDPPFESPALTTGDILLMTVHNNISSDVIFNYQKYYPDIWETMTKYYTTSESVLTQTTDTAINLKYSDTISISEAYVLEYKTYHSFNFINTLSLEQVKVDINGYLYIYTLDANGNLVEDISNIAKEHNYIKINHNFYMLDTTKEITYSKTDKTFKLPLNVSLIGTDRTWADIANEVKKIGTVTIEFQKNIESELQYIYINNAEDYSTKILRINKNSENNFNYIEYYLANKVNSVSPNKYEVRFKFMPPGANINIQNTDIKIFRFYTESPRIYLRDYIGNYIVTKLSNNQTPLLGYDIAVDNITYNSTSAIVEQYEKYYEESSCYSNLLDIPNYLIIGITNNSTPDGINNLSFAKEYITSTPESNTYMLPKINHNTNKFPTYFRMSETDSNNIYQSVYQSVSNKIITKYPVYELNIASGKYSADSIVKYMLRALDNLKSRVYDYSKGIFYTDTSFHKFIDLNNEFGINQESKFLISVDKSVHSISFKQYKKIFDAHKNTSVVKGQIAYYNEGFPYIYFNVPQISLLNNSLIYMSSGGSLGNMGGSATRGEKNIIVPLNYKVRVRQLLPFPKIDAVKNNQNLFAKEDFVDEVDEEIYNKYVDFINDAVNDKHTKNISIDYIVDTIFGIGESGYLDINNLSEDKLSNLKEGFTNQSMSKKGANMMEGSLQKSFLNNNGINEKYTSVKNFNNTSEAAFTSNRTGTEYYGQAMINGYRNEQPYKEYIGTDSPITDRESYGDSVGSGFETTFIQNELFMRLSDINVTNKDNIIGRLTKVEGASDKYGNIEVDYDLFSENCLNFKIGDIIIGLDSNTIGIIMPYDYKYNSLPNKDLMTLGAGAYLMNKSVMDSGTLIEKYLSVTTSSTKQRNLAKTFIYKMNNWQIERNKTNRGFYIYSNITPNESKLRGARMPNFQLYSPRFFKFLEGQDTALSKFGLKNSENNNQWNYFKTNYESNYSVDIKRSFFNAARNNEIYTDYLIFETKSIDNFSVNDKIYIENHDIILKGGDFRREKFFNVELLENYSGFISKLETIYNTTVLNHNGLSGIGKVTGSDSLDNKYLVDNEYKYPDTPGNSSAKATAQFDATITSIDIATAGWGYTANPDVTIDNSYRTTPNAAFKPVIERDASGNVSISTMTSLNTIVENAVLATSSGTEAVTALIELCTNLDDIIKGEDDLNTADTTLVKTAAKDFKDIIETAHVAASLADDIVRNVTMSYSGSTGNPSFTVIASLATNGSRIASENATRINDFVENKTEISSDNMKILKEYIEDAILEAREELIVTDDANTSIYNNSLSPTYSAIPNITIQSPAETATVNAELSSPAAGGGIYKAIIGDGISGVSGFGYTEPPNITASISGVTATASIVISGIGTATTTTAPPDNKEIWFNHPKLGDTGVDTIDYIRAKGIYRNEFNKVIIYKTGKGYSHLELSKIIMKEDSESGAQVDGSVSIDAIGSVTLGKGGSGYYNVLVTNADNNPICLPEVKVEGEGSDANIIPIVDISGTITGYTVIHGGSGYTHSTTISIDPPRAIFSTTIDTKGQLNGVTVLWQGKDYTSENSTLIVDPPKRTAIAEGVIGRETINITDSGTGYVKPPSCEYIDNTTNTKQTELLVSTNISSNITKIRITDRGIGYSSAPDCSFNGVIIGIATVHNGQLYEISVKTGVTFSSPANITKKLKVDITGGGGADGAAIATFGRGGIIKETVSTTLGSSTIIFDSPYKEASATATVDATITSITVDEGGEGYNDTPVVKINSTTIPEVTILNKLVTNIFPAIGLSLTGIITPPLVTISPPTNLTKIPVPFKNIAIYRYFNQEVYNYNMNYYLSLKSKDDTDAEDGKFTYNTLTDNITLTSLKILGANNVVNELIASKDLYIITISDDSGNKNTYVKNNVTKIFTLKGDVLKLDDTSNYHINIKAYRLPVAVSETKYFGTTSIDDSHKTRYISKYSTLGIFERLLDEQINRIYDNMSYNLIKAAELYRTYSVNVFRNRIIKLKVCPIDDKGFCYENALPDGSVANETTVTNRQVKGYSKKLFPYHEYDIIKSYDKSKFGRNVDIIGVPHKSYRRPHQLLKNTEQTSKAFLPGMGVYIINDETVKSGTRINNTHYNNTSATKDIELHYSEYNYTTNFIGYVLDTSVNSKQEYDRNYRLNADHFSKVDSASSVHSEYYIYMLINPDITTNSEIDELFSQLNRDNINIVFDANASHDYSENPLKHPGYVTSKNEYYVDSVTNTHKTKSDDKSYSISKNTYGNRSFLNEQDVLKFYEDETYTTEVSSSNIDAFLGLTASSIKIHKPALNKTLPYYSFQKRLACATIVSRPVAYEIKSDTNSRKLFHAGDYDYFYKNYLENKAVMRYQPIMDNTNIDNMNRHNMIIDNPTNKNFKANNFKETDCHSSYLDPNINSKEAFYDIGTNDNEYETIEGSKPIIKFNNGDDIILVDSYKNKYSYESGDIDYQEIKPIDDKKLGLPNTHIKILTGSVLPPLYFDHARLYDNRLNDYCNNVTILDKEFDSGLERLTYNGMLGKYKPDKIDIVGNNSSDYNGNDESDHKLYNKVFVTEITAAEDGGVNTTTVTISNTIGGISIKEENVDKLKECLFVINTNIKCKNETQPIDDTNNCEMTIITDAAYIIGGGDNADYITLTLQSALTDNTVNGTMRAYILYPTVTISEETVSPSLPSTEISIKIDGIGKIDIGDHIILGWGSMAHMTIRRVEKIDTVSKKITIKHPRPSVTYKLDARIIVLKNPLTGKSHISTNFISTQPFTMNKEWYTRIFYKGPSYNTGKHKDNSYTSSEILPNIKDNYVHGGAPLFNKNYSNTVYIGGMKGLKIPFIDIDTETSGSVFCRPLDDDFYDVVPAIKDDYQTDYSSAPNILKIPGVFNTRLDSLNNLSDFKNIPDINNIDEIMWKDGTDLHEYPSIVIKGLHLGYGGFIEDRANQDTINTMVNKASGVAIKKITQVKNTFYIYTQFSKTYNNILSTSNLSENYNLLNQGSRQTYLDYETNLRLLDGIFEKDDTKQDYEEHLAIFGKNGKIVRKKINTPYDMNPDNYIYMVIPDLNHITSVQNNDIDTGFAKILLPGESTKTLFSSFVAGTKIFYNNLFNNLTELEITFITNDGYLFDFNGSEHSFAIEITEIIDKFEYINPRFGNIEI